jgi:hypothetical protein
VEEIQSRQRALSNDAQELGKKLTFTIDDENPAISIEDIRKRWRDPEILHMAVALTKKAAEDVKKLYEDLENFGMIPTLTGKEKFQKMAETLVSREIFSTSFCHQETVTLLDIYRGIRFLEYHYRYTKDGQLFAETTEITEEDSQPFFKEGTPQWECREDYHEIIDLFDPIMQELKDLPPERQAEVQRYWKWAVRDDSPKIANDQDGGFKLNPADKPA